MGADGGTNDGEQRPSDMSPDWSSRQERLAAEVTASWESRRDGRPVATWIAEIEVRVTAGDETEARWRLAVYTHQPLYRTLDSGLLSGLGCFDGAGDIPAEVELVDGVDVAEQDRLNAGYPWWSTGAVFGRGDVFVPGGRVEVDEDLSALRLAARRLLGDVDVEVEVDAGALRPPQGEPPGVLRTWRAVHEAIFLAPDSQRSAWERAAELASMIVDCSGAPAGRLGGDRTYEVFPGASWELIAAWWDDYDAAQGTVGQPVVLAALLSDAPARLERDYSQATVDVAFEELVRNPQLDGTLTVSRIEEFAAAAAAARGGGVGLCWQNGRRAARVGGPGRLSGRPGVRQARGDRRRDPTDRTAAPPSPRVPGRGQSMTIVVVR